MESSKTARTPYATGHATSATDHAYAQDNSGIIVENRNCSPLIQKQNPILNQTDHHISSNHDENTDLNVRLTFCHKTHIKGTLRCCDFFNFRLFQNFRFL